MGPVHRVGACGLPARLWAGGRAAGGPADALPADPPRTADRSGRRRTVAGRDRQRGGAVPGLRGRARGDRVSGGHRHGHGGGHAHDRAVPAGSRHRRPLAIVLGISSTILVAAVLAGRPATDARTWGYRRAEVLAAAAQAAVLLAVGGFVLVEGVRRLIEPPSVASGVMIVFGVAGLLGNMVSILLLMRIQASNLNTRAALLEVVNDALGAAAVLVAAVAIAVTGWHRADAVASLLIGVMILQRTWKLLRENVEVLMEATP